MKRTVQWMVALALTTLLLSAAGCNKLKARDQLNKGVQAYRAARYEAAIEHFKNAVNLDPKLLNAKLYLATAYAQQYIPGLDSEENNRMGQAAVDEYKKVLEDDAKNVTALKGVASLYFNMKRFEEAKEYHRKVLEVDPNDPEAYYSIAVIDWTQTYQAAAELKAAEGLKVDDDITKNKKMCEDLRSKNESAVNEGVEMLEKAIQIRPDYADAMAYLNLLYRRRADIRCGDAEARMADLKTADEWVEKTLAIKKAEAERQAQAGAGAVTTEQPQ